MPPFVYVLMLHGVLGFIDIIVDHELLEKLPARGNAVQLRLNGIFISSL